MTDDLWIRSHHPAPGAGVRLACFPHAGGAAGYWFPLSAALTPGIEVLSVQYPGRHDRLREEPFTRAAVPRPPRATLAMPFCPPQATSTC
jgi:hypothetical protein